MFKELIIVESPSKMKTLRKMLGDKYIFQSSVGHIRDLPAKSLGIDIEHDFEPEYRVLEGKEKVVQSLIDSARKCKRVYLCPDPDREGEAIAWHLRFLIPKEIDTVRATFNSITKREVVRALENPSEINLDLVNAQQARRLLDRLVGYTISPLLVRRVQGGKPSKNVGALSAGRVQSVALKLVVDREHEIIIFVPVEYWSIVGVFTDVHGNKLSAILISINDTKIKGHPDDKSGILLSSESHVCELLKKLVEEKFSISAIDSKTRLRHPSPPFITSSLQQEASRLLGFSPSKTMSIAQSLYEGVDLGDDVSEGLITYIRTDSVRAVSDVIESCRIFIKSEFGDKFLSESVRTYKSKKSAQDSHECIRPTNVLTLPESVKNFLSRDQLSLYVLIWNRFVASQMSSAKYDLQSITITGNNNSVFRATLSKLSFKGFLSVYLDEDESYEDCSLGSKVCIGPVASEFSSNQSFTKAPPRYTEASLIKELERSGVGRPSTYASIMSKIQDRAYTEKDNGRLRPTELGMLVEKVLSSNFASIMDVSFTANMEDKLEKISAGESDWKSVLFDFWSVFEPVLRSAETSLVVPKEQLSQLCPMCSKPLNKIWSRSKFFIGCSGYPECSYTASVNECDKSKFDPDFDWDQTCPTCKSSMIVREGRFGYFLGCSQFPTCKGVVSIPVKGHVLDDVSMPCPAIGCDGTIKMKMSRFAKKFCGCSNYPACDVIAKDMETVSSKFDGREKTAVQKKKGKKKEVLFSAEKPLSDIVGADSFTKSEILSKVFKYIKSCGLQDPDDKRYVLVSEDNVLKALFPDKLRVHIFSISKIVSKKIVRL